MPSDQEPQTFGSQITDVPVRLVKDLETFKAALRRHYGEGVTHPRESVHGGEAVYVVTAPQASTGPPNLVKTLQDEGVLKKDDE
ncbi:uncharacterized protein FTJAE_13889 [Fusarium tjaetaba]|uniref:Uncharacterized protein n=1 Tax=Fusarium tjaetaba TaxID=1567544 RepID=A0A8H5QGZ7_9HYPO|nr:uncharacterized protein FTJAE_13889 [Fusarium tjaetaba]KAF5613626.1 hypothetical protein FTJAE_13889 [Fusarium tjaetaba]